MAHPLYKIQTMSSSGITLADEFIMAVLRGDRDFANMQLEDNFNLNKHPRADELRKYLKEADLENNPIVLSRARLRGITATNLNLRFLEAEGIDCVGGNFAGSLLDHALLRGSGLQSVDFRGASLEFADLHAAFLHEANCSDAKMRGAYLHGAVLTDATLVSAYLMQAHLDSAYCLRTSFDAADLTQAELTYGNFRNASFRGAKLARALLHRAQFRGVDRTGTDFDNAILAENAHWE